jgi:hypothetical protein
MGPALSRADNEVIKIRRVQEMEDFPMEVQRRSATLRKMQVWTPQEKGQMS